MCYSLVLAAILAFPADLPNTRPFVEINVDKLPKLRQPIQKPPKSPPPRRPGHSWHWHQNHGWIALPAHQAPRVTILPPTYVLPRHVVIPQKLIYVVCPHCGNTFQVDSQTP